MNVEEFKIKVLTHKDKCYRFALRILNDNEEAKDTLQEVFLRLWNKRDKLENHSNIEAFAMLTTKNLCIDKLRSSKKFIKEYKFENLIDNNLIDKIAEQYDSVEKVKKIIESLPLQQKMVIQLCDIEGFSIDETSKQLDMQNLNVRVALSRARKKVKEILIKEYNYERY